MDFLGTYLVLQACISFCSVSNKSGAFLFLPSNAVAQMITNTNFWKVLMGAYKQGLEPQIFRETRARIFTRKSGLLAFLADRDQLLCTSQSRGTSGNCHKSGLFGLIGGFWAKPPFAKPPFRSPRKLTCSHKNAVAHVDNQITTAL